MAMVVLQPFQSVPEREAGQMEIGKAGNEEPEPDRRRSLRLVHMALHTGFKKRLPLTLGF